MLFYSFIFCRPIAHFVIVAHESVRICVTGPGHSNHFYQCHTSEKKYQVYLLLPIYGSKLRAVMELRCEDKAVLSLKGAVEFIFNNPEERKQI